MMRHRRKQRGFAVVMALVLLALVGVTVMTMMTGVALESRRTRTLQDEAQLRQLLLAGGAIVRQQAADEALQSTGISLPRELAVDWQLRIEQESADESSASIAIEAAADQRRMRQVMALVRMDDRWRVESVHLD